MNEELKYYKPNYDYKCDVCGQKPVVDLVNKVDEVFYSTNMCGQHTWGEAKTIDPDTWN